MPRFDVQPFDRHECRGCGQLLDFDSRGFVSDAALRACESRCAWVLVERRGVPVEVTRGIPMAGGNPPGPPATTL